jgi:hypothetical protein
MVHRDLSPTMRDVVAAVLLTLSERSLQRATYFEAVEHIIRRYGDAGLAAARGLPVETVIELVRLNRSVQFFVNDFAGSRLQLSMGPARDVVDSGVRAVRVPQRWSAAG